MRNFGDLSFPANLEVQKAAPLDPRTVVEKKTDLYDLETWKSTDGLYYPYVGMIVSVTGDTEENNGTYRLDDVPVNIQSNWIQIGEATPVIEPDIEDFYWYAGT
jgi:hypothetical protein